MDTADYKLDLRQIKLDLYRGIHECSQRSLVHSVKWLAEINHALSHVKLKQEDFPVFTSDLGEESEAYYLSKSYFDVKEYDRAAHFAKDCVKPKLRFLYYYARYCSAEKKKLDNMTDTNCPPDPTKNQALKNICADLKNDYYEDKLDAYCIYLYGVILKKLDLGQLAVDAYVKAVNLEPLLWCAWYELGKIIPNKTINTVQLPEHWIKQFFLGHVYLEQLQNNESLQIYLNLYSQGLEKSTYLMAQLALVHHNRRELPNAISMFENILQIDPYRLDNLDTYSNLLYVMEMNTQLADLAHKVVLIDKYRVETCCIIGNFYSLRSDHPKAVLYFKRALKLNPQFLSAWTLMGHEYMEMKNTNAAIQSYRHAIEINNRDYRAWYGLGQTYEIMKMPFYCLHYYKQAQQLKPNDSRMIIALGETYEKLDKTENALKCYYKACTLGDIEGIALIKLGKLYDKLQDADNAALAFSEYCLREGEIKDKVPEDQTEFFNALSYLAMYHYKKRDLDNAYIYASKCIECEETKEQGKALLKDIQSRRPEHNNEQLEMNDSMANATANEPGSSLFIFRGNSGLY